MRQVILGTTWAAHEPHLRLRRAESARLAETVHDAKTDGGSSAIPLIGKSVLEPLRGFVLGYRLSDGADRRCLGHVPFRRGHGDYHDCANNPEPGSRRCERCMIVEATFASNLHHAHTRGSGELDPAIVEHLGQPNQLYLAAFRDGSLKVGTTTAARRDKRLAEQGAWRALIVADADDGYIVREIEDRVTEELSLSQAVNVRRKIAGLVSPVGDDQLDAQLRSAATDVHALIEQMNSPRLRPVDEPILWTNPAADDLADTKLYDYPLPLDRGSHDLVFTNAVGRVAIAQRAGGDDHFAIDLQGLFGYELELGDFGSGEIAIQDSLF